MKRFLMLLLMLATLLMTATAMAATDAVIRPVTEDDRARLMLTESRKSKILGKYYGGVPVTVLETSGDMARVDIFGRTGWMGLERLCLEGDADYETLAAGPVGMPGVRLRNFVVYDVSGKYEHIGELAEGTIRVLGIATQDQFIHVMVQRDDGSRLTGLTLNHMVGRGDDLGLVLLDSGKADKRINVRMGPSKKYQVTGQIWSGTELHVCYDWAEPKEGWVSVIVGNSEWGGYVMSNFVRPRSGGDNDWTPPTAELRRDPADWFTDAEEHFLDRQVTARSSYMVLGTMGDWYLVRRTDADGAMADGFMRKRDMRTNGKSTIH